MSSDTQETPGIESRGSLRVLLGLAVIVGATVYIVTTAMSSTVHHHSLGEFSAGTGVIATGVLREEGVFEADSLSTQCPSRYENEAPTADELGQTP